MRNRRDELPDLSDITGEWDSNGNPLYRRDLTDTADPARIAEYRDRVVARINELPANAQSDAGWDTPNKFGVSDLELYGPRDSYGLSDEQKKLAYDAVVNGRSRSDGVETLEHGHVLGDTGLNGLSQADLDALDARDQGKVQQAAELWQDFQDRYPELSADPQLVSQAIAVADAEIRDFGDNPEYIAKRDRDSYLKHVGQAARSISLSKENEATYQELRGETDDNRTTSVSYGEGARHSEPEKKEDKDGLVEQLKYIQRRSGLW